jgi:macrolide transport system ATP-binding/permease protein
MVRLGELWRRLWFRLNRARLEREIEAEMAAHREAMPDPSRFGSSLRLREEARDVWGWIWLDALAQDAAHAFRMIRRAPVYGLTAALILSLGIGLNLAFFQILDATLLQPPPIRDPGSLVRFHRYSPRMHSSGVPYAATQFYRGNNSVLSAVVTESANDMAWGGNAGDRVAASFVSANYFEELGYGPALGRVFTESIDERLEAPPVVVVSHDFWRERLAANPGAIGLTVRLNDRPATVIGVAPPVFPGLKWSTPQLWLLIHQIDYFNPGTDFKNAWRANNTDMYGRLRPGVGVRAAQEGLSAAVRRLAAEHPAEFSADEWLEGYSGSARFMTPKDLRAYWSVAGLITALTLLVLLVACSNLATLVLSRASGRLREFAMRTALGAGRGRIVRQLVTESGCLLVLGLAGGWAAGATAARIVAVQSGAPAHLDLGTDWRTLAAAIALSVFPIVVCGLVPALRIVRQDLSLAMKDGGQQSSASLGRARLQKVLVAAQVAGSCVLLFVAATMVRGVQRLLTSDPGFEFENVAVLDPSLERYGLKGAEAKSYWDGVERDIAAHPGVESAVLVSHSPLGRSLGEAGFQDAPGLKVTVMNVGMGFFRLMRIRMLAGRDFEPGDDPASSVIISRRLAAAMYGGSPADVLGAGFPKSRPRQTIVGVAADAHLIKMEATDVAESYSPLLPDQYPGLLLIARSRTDPEGLLEPMRAAARRADRRVLARASLVKADFERRLEMPRLSARIASLVGFLALALSSLGIFGLLSYAVAARTREIGVRVALGARGASILALLLGQLWWPVLSGAALGAIAGTAAGKVLSRAPFYLDPADPAVPLLAILILLAAGGLAALLPARRALSIDPVQALRSD